MKQRQNRSDGGGLFSRFRSAERTRNSDPSAEVIRTMTEEERMQDLIERYGSYLDEDQEPFRGINPNPKYYVVPKERPEEERKRIPKKVTARPAEKPPAVVKIKLKKSAK